MSDQTMVPQPTLNREAELDLLEARVADALRLARKAGAHSGDVNCVSWHPSRPDILASCGDDGAVKIWRVASARTRV